MTCFASNTYSYLGTRRLNCLLQNRHLLGERTNQVYLMFYLTRPVCLTKSYPLAQQSRVKLLHVIFVSTYS